MNIFELLDFLPWYPDQENEKIQLITTALKEFKELSSDENEPVPKKGEYYKHQLFAQRYLIPYDELALIHLVGTGKTCASVGAAENNKKYGTFDPESYEKVERLSLIRQTINLTNLLLDNKSSSISKVFIIVPSDKVGQQWKDEIICKCTDGKYETERLIDSTPGVSRGKILSSILKPFYNFKNYQEFANRLKDIHKNQIASLYSNTFFIFDEIHVLRNNKEAESILFEMKKLINNSKSSKTLLLTATPVVRDVKEISITMGLLDEKSKINISDNTGNISYDFKSVEKSLRGKISYIKELNTEVKVVEEGIKPPDYVNISHNIYLSPMSKFQAKSYLQQPKKDVYKLLLGASRAVYPDGNPNSLEAYSNYDPNIKKNQSPKPNKELKPFLSNREPENPKDIEYLSYLSRKTQNIIDICKNSKGLNYIYIEMLIDTGLYFLSMALQEQGFKLFKETKTVFTQKNYDKIKRYCKENNKNNLILKSKIKKEPRIAIITGSTPREEIKIILNTFNSYQNRHGDIIKCIIGTKTIQTGINLFNIRHIHFPTGLWNDPEKEQAKGRGIRVGGHDDIINELQDINISIMYMYLLDSFNIEENTKKLRDLYEEYLKDKNKHRKEIIEMINLMKDKITNKLPTFDFNCKKEIKNIDKRVFIYSNILIICGKLNIPIPLRIYENILGSDKFYHLTQNREDYLDLKNLKIAIRVGYQYLIDTPGNNEELENSYRLYIQDQSFMNIKNLIESMERSYGQIKKKIPIYKMNCTKASTKDIKDENYKLFVYSNIILIAGLLYLEFDDIDHDLYENINFEFNNYTNLDEYIDEFDFDDDQMKELNKFCKEIKEKMKNVELDTPEKFEAHLRYLTLTKGYQKPIIEIDVCDEIENKIKDLEVFTVEEQEAFTRYMMLKNGYQDPKKLDITVHVYHHVSVFSNGAKNIKDVINKDKNPKKQILGNSNGLDEIKNLDLQNKDILKTVDVYVYQKAEMKNRETTKIDRYLKEIAVDAQIQEKRNRRIGQDGKSKCDYQKCEIDFVDPPPLSIFENGELIHNFAYNDNKKFYYFDGLDWRKFKGKISKIVDIEDLEYNRNGLIAVKNYTFDRNYDNMYSDKDIELVKKEIKDLLKVNSNLIYSDIFNKIDKKKRYVVESIINQIESKKIVSNKFGMPNYINEEQGNVILTSEYPIKPFYTKNQLGLQYYTKNLHVVENRKLEDLLKEKRKGIEKNIFEIFKENFNQIENKREYLLNLETNIKSTLLEQTLRYLDDNGIENEEGAVDFILDFYKNSYFTIRLPSKGLKEYKYFLKIKKGVKKTVKESNPVNPQFYIDGEIWVLFLKYQKYGNDCNYHYLSKKLTFLSIDSDGYVKYKRIDETSKELTNSTYNELKDEIIEKLRNTKEVKEDEKEIIKLHILITVHKDQIKGSTMWAELRKVNKDLRIYKNRFWGNIDPEQNALYSAILQLKITNIFQNSQIGDKKANELLVFGFLGPDNNFRFIYKNYFDHLINDKEIQHRKYSGLSRNEVKKIFSKINDKIEILNQIAAFDKELPHIEKLKFNSLKNNDVLCLI